MDSIPPKTPLPKEITPRSGIYAITNIVNGKEYIGSSVYIRHRWRQHRDELARGIHHCKHLQYAYNIYGCDAFLYSVIEVVDDANSLLQREQFYIDTRLPEYNSLLVAGSSLGSKQTDATRRKISEFVKNDTANSERLRKMGAARRGVPLSELTRQKIAESNRGRVHSAESNRKISIANKGKKKPPFPPEWHRKQSERFKGKKKPPFSDEHKKHIKEAKKAQASQISKKLKGHPVTEETREKLRSAAHKQWETYIPNDEQRRKLSEASRNKVPKTHCIHGHEYTPANTYINVRGYRECVTCHRNRVRVKKPSASSMQIETSWKVAQQPQQQLAIEGSVREIAAPTDDLISE